MANDGPQLPKKGKNNQPAPTMSTVANVNDGKEVTEVEEVDDAEEVEEDDDKEEDDEEEVVDESMRRSSMSQRGGRR